MNIYRIAPLALTALSLLACGRKNRQAANIQTAPVTRRTIVIDAQAAGTVEPINVVEVKSKASGVITRMTVETGTAVKPGDLLAQVDTRDVQNQYNQALADVRAAEARLEVAVAQKRRSDEMFRARVITAQEHEASTLDYANAQAQVVRARASLDLAKQRLEDATVTAPVAGTVIEKTVSLGQVITSATGAFGGGSGTGGADPEDLRLDVAIVEAGSRVKLVRRAWAMRNQRLVEDPGVVLERGRIVEVEGGRTFNVDGEVMRPVPPRFEVTGTLEAVAAS